jgi:hypothetical protein
MMDPLHLDEHPHAGLLVNGRARERPSEEVITIVDN